MKASSLNNLAVIAALLLIVFASPYFVWGVMSSRIIRVLLLLTLCFIFIKRKKPFTQSDTQLLLLYFFITSLYLFLGVMHGMNINGLIFTAPYLLLGYICFCRDSFESKVYDYFLWGYSVIMLLSLISWVLVTTGHPISIGTLAHPSQDRTYFVYPFLLVENSFVNSVRFNGPFDEPGVVGTIGALLLCINGFNLKDWKNVVILISGLLSLSLYFYGVCAIYWILTNLIIKKRYGVVFLLVVFFTGFFIFTRTNDIMYEYMWRRIELNEEGTSIVGDTRMNEVTTTYYNSIKGTTQYFFGVSNRDEILRNLEGSSSYKVVILYNGLIFFVLYCSFFILLAYNNRNGFWPFVLFVLLFLLTIYQRTNIYSALYMFLYAYLARRGMGYSQKAVSR